jgi:PAS domain-containing protein
VLDILHRIVAANASFLELFHRTHREVAGASIGELLWPMDGGAELYNFVDEALQTGSWFLDLFVDEVVSDFPEGPLVVGGHRICGADGGEPLVLLTVQRSERDCA